VPSGASAVNAWVPSGPVLASTARHAADPVVETVTAPGVRAASRCPHSSSTHTTACSARPSKSAALAAK
jgi:hypothetical protein